MSLTLLAPTLLAAALVAPDPGSVREEARCAEVAFSRSVEGGDLDAFVSWIDPQARFVGAGVAVGPEEVARAWAPFFAPDGPRIAWRPELVEVLGDGTLALTRGPYRLRERDEAGEWTEHWGTFTSVWRRGDEGWRVVFDAGGQAQLEPTPETRALLDGPTGCLARP